MLSQTPLVQMHAGTCDKTSRQLELRDCIHLIANRLPVTKDRSLCREGMSAVRVNCCRYCGVRSVTTQHLISLHGDLEDDPFRHS